MGVAALIVTLVIGAFAGWLAALLVHGTGFGVGYNILIGIAGAIVAAFLFPRLGLGLTLGGGMVGTIAWATIGAVILLLIARLLSGAFA